MKNNRSKTGGFPSGWTIPLLAVLAWFLWGLSGAGGRAFLPTIDAVIKAAYRLILNGTLQENIRISVCRAFKGLLLGGGIGFLLGILNGLSVRCNNLLNTPIQMIRNIPYLAMMPLILVWFGIGESTKTVLIAIGTFFPIYLDTFHGIKSIDKNLLEMAHVYGIKGRALYLHVILPGALPSIMVGLKQSLGRMWVILIVAEEIAAKSGIGYMVTNAREYMLMDVIVLGIIMYAVLGSLSDIVTTFAEHRLLKWMYVKDKEE